MTDSKVQPTLLGWLVRDVSILILVTTLVMSLGAWHQNASAWYSAAIAGVVGFVGVYALCYVVHEWGHTLGARFAGADDVPLLGYKNILMSAFDIRAHTTRQFLWLSWGGVVGYLVVATIGLVVFAAFRPHAGLAGVAVGALAFVLQSLAVDVPQILRVQGGGDAFTVNREGASPAVIGRRTLQTWSALALAVVVWNV